MITSEPVIPELIKAETRDDETQNAPKQARILIVEDEAGIRDLLEELLFMEGYLITAVDNGSDGVSRFTEEGHDLVFTDLRMPGMSGWDVAKAVKSHNPKTPVVIVTGWDTETLGSELHDAGVDRVLQKPFDMDEVLNLVTELLDAA